MWHDGSAVIRHAQDTLRLNIVSARALNKFGNLFLGEREQLLVYRYFGQFHLTGRNTYGRKKEKAAQQDFEDACQYALCPTFGVHPHVWSSPNTPNGSDSLGSQGAEKALR